ncbi:MAG: Asp-tRNA(Asn)/Glu-tRNA(Gln) amidotransferase subunit GatC [Chloroflexota bacterium]|nr:Asp-tRNA(Asn)/Glu-tRNA(Gln) amidotransferase subunit GatC [Chloroflexota bacterium]
MRLSRQEVVRIAELARLELCDEEVEQYREQLSDILDYFAHLQTVDTSMIPPTSGAQNLLIRLRDDVPRAGLSRQDLMQNAPDTDDDQFRIPPVLD